MSEIKTPLFIMGVVSLLLLISEHPKNKGLYKPHLLRCGAPLFFDL